MSGTTELIRQYEALLDRKSELEEQVKENNKSIEEARRTLTEAMIDEEVDKLTTNGYSYTLGEKLCFSKKGGVDEELFETLRDDGLGDLIKETVNTRTLQSAMKDMAERNDGELPPQYDGLITVYRYMDVTRRKTK